MKSETEIHKVFTDLILKDIRKYTENKKWARYKDFSKEDLTMTITITIAKSSFWRIINELERKELIVIKKVEKHNCNTKFFCLAENCEQYYEGFS